MSASSDDERVWRGQRGDAGKLRTAPRPLLTTRAIVDGPPTWYAHRIRSWYLDEQSPHWPSEITTPKLSDKIYITIDNQRQSHPGSHGSDKHRWVGETADCIAGSSSPGHPVPHAQLGPVDKEQTSRRARTRGTKTMTMTTHHMRCKCYCRHRLFSIKAWCLYHSSRS